MIIDLNIKCILHNKNYFCKGNVIIFLEVIEKEDPYPLSENWVLDTIISKGSFLVWNENNTLPVISREEISTCTWRDFLFLFWQIILPTLGTILSEKSPSINYLYTLEANGWSAYLTQARFLYVLYWFIDWWFELAYSFYPWLAINLSL